MEVNNLIEFLQKGHIQVNKALAQAIGLQEAVMYCELVSKYKYFCDRNRLTKDGYFYNTAEDMQESTTLTKRQQKYIIEKLIETGLIEYIPKRGMPATRHFKIVLEEAVISKYIPLENDSDIQKLQNVTTGSDEMLLQEATKGNLNNLNNNLDTKNNKEEEEESIFNFYLENISKEIEAYTKEQLATYIQHFKEPDVVMEAIKQATLHGKNKKVYLFALLKDMHLEGVKTIEEAIHHIETHRQGYKKKTDVPQKSTRSYPTTEETRREIERQLSTPDADETRRYIEERRKRLEKIRGADNAALAKIKVMEEEATARKTRKIELKRIIERYKSLKGNSFEISIAEDELLQGIKLEIGKEARREVDAIKDRILSIEKSGFESVDEFEYLSF